MTAFDVIVRTQGRRPGSLAEALVSLGAQQTDCEFAVLVVVHGPEETAAGVEAGLKGVDGLPDSWSVHAIGESGKRARPLNAGLDEARGDYTVFLDDDDLAYPDWLAVFAEGADEAPGRVIRAVAESQAWATSGAGEPRTPSGAVSRPYAERFDLLAHFSHNETPICSMALPREALRRWGLRFDEDLDLLEDWDLLMRAALRIGVRSKPRATSLYRRLDSGSASSESDEKLWIVNRRQVLRNLGAEPLRLPGGDATRLAEARFTPGGPPVTAVADRALPPQWRSEEFQRLHDQARNRLAAAFGSGPLGRLRRLARRVVPGRARS